MGLTVTSAVRSWSPETVQETKDASTEEQELPNDPVGFPTMVI